MSTGKAQPPSAPRIPMSSGATLVTLQEYLQRQHGAGSFDRVVAAMPPGLAEPLHGILLPQRRYPTESVVATMDAARAVFGPADFHEQYGEWSALYTINAFFRLFLRFRSPAWLATRTEQIWSRFHDSGAWQVKSEERSYRGTLRDFAVVNAGFCGTMLGWMRGAGKLTGEDQMRVEHSHCRANGAPACVFDARW